VERLSGILPLPDSNPDNIFRQSLAGHFPVDHGKETDRDYFMQIGLGQSVEPFSPEGRLTASEDERAEVGQFQGRPGAASNRFDQEIKLSPVALFRLYQEPPGNAEGGFLDIVVFCEDPGRKSYDCEGCAGKTEFDAVRILFWLDQPEGKTFNVVEVHSEQPGRSQYTRFTERDDDRLD